MQGMKKNVLLFVASIILATTTLASPAGKTKGEQIDVLFTTKNQKAEQTRPKAPALRLFSAVVDTDSNAVFVSSRYDVGEVSVTLENISTGDFYSYTFDSADTALLPINCASGFWTIMLILDSGAEYVGEFEL